MTQAQYIDDVANAGAARYAPQGDYMAKDQKKKTIDDYLMTFDRKPGFSSEGIKDHEKFFKDNQDNQVQLDVMFPALDAGYESALSVAQKDLKKNPGDKIGKNKDEFYTFVNAYYEGALKKATPKQVEDLQKELKGLKGEDRYHRLQKLYTQNFGQHGDGLVKYFENLKSSPAKLNDILLEIQRRRVDLADSGYNALIQQSWSARVSHLPQATYLRHVKGMIEKEGYQIEDETGYFKRESGEVARAHHAVLSGKLNKEIAEDYGFKKKEEKKK